jgi:hypothetical protein
MKERMRVGEGAEEALAARGASRMCFDGAREAEDICSDARAGAIIRGSSMAFWGRRVGCCSLMTFRSLGGGCRNLALALLPTHHREQFTCASVNPE